jgi:hypothetical protein
VTGTEKQLSQPLYEGLPWIYVLAGAAGLFGSYVMPYRAWSIVIGLLGFLSILAGVVVLLRRRDYRELRSQYRNQDSSLSDLGKD